MNVLQESAGERMPSSFFSYWFLVTRRAWRDALASIGASPAKTTYKVLTIVAATAIGYYLTSDEGWEKPIIGLISGLVMFVVFFGFYLIQAPWRMHQDQEMAIAKEKEDHTEKLLAAVRAGEAARQKAAAIPTPPGKVKDFLHRLGLRSKAILDSRQDASWFEAVREIFRNAVSSRVYNLYLEDHNRNDFRACCQTWLIHAMNIHNDDIDTTFKPEEYEQLL